MMEEEIWKDIVGYEGLYQVSNLGNVKSLPKDVIMPRNRGIRRQPEKILVQCISSRGYNIVSLYKKSTKKEIDVHILVAMAFLSHIPCKYERVVNHKNFIRTDNRLDNLEIITHRENTNRKHIKHTSIYTGVCWDKSRNKWYSSINVKGKNIRLGRFSNEYDAHLAYENKLKEIQL